MARRNKPASPDPHDIAAFRPAMHSALEAAPLHAPLPAWACVAAVIQAALFFASLTLIVLS